MIDTHDDDDHGRYDERPQQPGLGRQPTPATNQHDTSDSAPNARTPSCGLRLQAERTVWLACRRVGLDKTGGRQTRVLTGATWRIVRGGHAALGQITLTIIRSHRMHGMQKCGLLHRPTDVTVT